MFGATCAPRGSLRGDVGRPATVVILASRTSPVGRSSKNSTFITTPTSAGPPLVRSGPGTALTRSLVGLPAQDRNRWPGLGRCSCAVGRVGAERQGRASRTPRRPKPAGRSSMCSYRSSPQPKCCRANATTEFAADQKWHSVNLRVARIRFAGAQATVLYSLTGEATSCKTAALATLFN